MVNFHHRIFLQYITRDENFPEMMKRRHRYQIQGNTGLKTIEKAMVSSQKE